MQEIQKSNENSIVHPEIPVYGKVHAKQNFYTGDTHSQYSIDQGWNKFLVIIYISGLIQDINSK